MVISLTISERLRAQVLVTLAIGTFLLTLLNALFTPSVRALQADVAQRQQYLNESTALGRLNAQIIQALANMSAQSNDEAIRALLARNGVTFKVNPPASLRDTDHQDAQ